ncbi:MAG: thioredoxin domain-containing protein [Chloroflexi bacterium]|nr:thioredoxin domain-containing protein [Chloroflexota bacterium]
MTPVLQRLVDAHPDAVQLTYRHFPLLSIHDKAQKSSEAAEAAGAQDAFWEYHDALYEQQAEWAGKSPDEARDYFVELAAELGLDVARFTADLDDGVYADYVSALYEEAVNLKLTGTPSIILNGQLIPAESIPRDFTIWDTFIKQQVQVKALADRQYDAPPSMTIDENGRYLARVTMESGDAFVIELLSKSAPQTVNSFIFLAEEGWFDGVTFHRVLPGFVAQTGDPSGTGAGDPGYVIPNEVDPALSHDEAGVVAMANSGPDTNGSQWYITLDDVSQLDGGYTIFGRVIEGMKVVEEISLRDPSRSPDEPPGDVIISVTIEKVE